MSERKPADDGHVNADVYEYMEHGGSVQRDLEGLSLSEMEDYFGDQDPIAFL